MHASSPSTPTPRNVADGAEAYLRWTPERRDFFDWFCSETPEVVDRVEWILTTLGGVSDAHLACIREARGWV